MIQCKIITKITKLVDNSIIPDDPGNLKLNIYKSIDIMTK